MQAEPLIDWPEPLLHLVEFAAIFLAAGAVGFRYSALRGRLGLPGTAGGGHDARVYADAARRAALLGILGSLLGAGMLVRSLVGVAVRRHVGVVQLVTGSFLTGAEVVLMALAIIGFALASRGVRAGWLLAAVGVVVGQVRGLLLGQISRQVNPMHVLSGALWIGTLFVLVFAGISVVLRDEPARERRGAIVADMVNGFSPLALVCGGLLVLFGAITAWRHLHTLSALWTTPYGYALIAKLCVVAVVFGLGAWNWRRQRPTLGSESAATAVRRSARYELTAAAIVLCITAILVSLPSPRRPGAPEGPRGERPAGAPSAGAPSAGAEAPR